MSHLEIDKFIKELSESSNYTNVHNHYDNSDPSNIIRRSNLELYLKSMYNMMDKSESARILLVGEAPGFLGCRLSGIPFTSEYIMMKSDVSLFGKNNGFKVCRESNKHQKEATATIVWEVLKSRENIPLLWNAFPFHPYKEGMEDSNRKPTEAELKKGKEAVDSIILIFGIERVIAVGNKAYESLKSLDKKYKLEKVRHPSHGGKEEFVVGVNRIVT